MRPTLVGTKNLYENGPNPFYFYFFQSCGNENGPDFYSQVRLKQHIGEVRSKIYNPERELNRILKFQHEIDYGLKAFQDWQPQFYPIVAFVYMHGHHI